MYQNQGKTAFKHKLTNILSFSAYLNHPEILFRSIHVAGTNGKGSTSHMLASILQEAGYKVGLYTSPHLKDFRERIKINGKEIPEHYVVDFIERHKQYLTDNDLSFFEMTVGLAFDFFAVSEVDIAIIEVGLGGRLDSTNIITPEVSVITNIGLDHTDMLGDTLEKIAFEKAGIIKPGVPVVISEFNEATYPVFVEVAKHNNSPVYLGEDVKVDYKTDLLGGYQKKNSKGAIKAIELLSGFNVDKKEISRGLMNVVKNTGLKGRWQVLADLPLTIADTAHNFEGLSLVLAQLKQIDYKQLHIVLGFVKDKDVSKILGLFPKEATYYFTQPKNSRAMEASHLKRLSKDFDLAGDSYDSVYQALESARHNAGIKDVIYIGGSTFVVAEII